VRRGISSVRLDVGTKLALTGLLLLAPLIVTTVVLIGELWTDIARDVRVRDGLAYVADLRRLIEPMTAHRGTTTLSLAGDPRGTLDSRVLEKEVDAALHELQLSDGAHGPEFGTSTDIATIASMWARLETGWPSMSIDEDRAQHNALALAIVTVNERVASAAGFQLDRQLESHYLLDAVGLRLLPIANLTGWLRSELAGDVVVGTLSGRSRDRVVASYQNVRGLVDLLDTDMRKSLELNDPRTAAIGAKYERFKSTSADFHALADDLLAARTLTVAPGQVMTVGGAAKSATFALYDEARALSLRVIGDRIQSHYRHAAITLAATFTLALLAVWFAARLRGQIARQLSSARTAFTGMEAGDFDVPLVPETLDEAGDVVAALARMQQALKARTERDAVLAAVADYSDSAVLITDAAGLITWLNAGFTRMTGVTAANAIGRTVEDVLGRRRVDAKACDELIEARAAGKAWRGDLSSIAADGREYFAHVEAQPVVSGDGTTKAYIVIETDVTERQRAAEALRAARDAAEAGSRAKSAFLANMSHEIRTPLNGVIGMTGLLLDTSLDPQQQEFAEIARASGEGLLTLINDILDFSKIEAGHLELESVDFDAVALIESAADTVVLRAVEKGVEVLVDIDPALPRYVRGDPSRLRQVLLNLIGNAIKFTERGEIRVGARPITDGGRARTRVEVRDTGIGMNADQVSRLFAPFSQADSSMTRRFGGTGLGLSITKRLIEAMGGKIWVESELGRGSAFIAELPFDPALTQPLAPPRTTLSGKHMLVVEDHAINRRILEKQLESAGCRATLVESASAALSTWSRLTAVNKLPDAVIMDHDLPDMDGATLAEQMRAQVGAAMPPVVMLTSLGGLVRAQAGESGCVRLLTKPVKRDALVQVLEEVIGTALEPQSSPTDRPRSTELALLRVLVAEDNLVNQKLVERLLGKLGITVTLAGNGVEAIERLRDTPIDLVLMDCQMPELDGYEATQRIRAGAAGTAAQNLPIIALTAHALAGDRDRCLLAGMSDYLTKPIDPKALRAMIERHAGHQRDGLAAAEAFGTAATGQGNTETGSG
jgi:PAS domain S-box-containing protein